MVNGALFMGLFNAIDMFQALRDLFYHEHHNRLYGPFSFVSAFTLHALPTDILSVVIMTLFSLYVVGMSTTMANFWNLAFGGFAGMHFGESLGMICIIWSGSLVRNTANHVFICNADVAY